MRATGRARTSTPEPLPQTYQDCYGASYASRYPRHDGASYASRYPRHDGASHASRYPRHDQPPEPGQNHTVPICTK
jgi:hypothetical protein